MNNMIQLSAEHQQQFEILMMCSILQTLHDEEMLTDKQLYRALELVQKPINY